MTYQMEELRDIHASFLNQLMDVIVLRMRGMGLDQLLLQCLPSHLTPRIITMHNLISTNQCPMTIQREEKEKELTKSKRERRISRLV